MKSYLVKTPQFVQRLFPKRVWAFPTTKKEVYLTFDDGPIPEVSSWVMDLLKEHRAKATFFCIGDNITKHPEVFNKIITEGHAIGNHTYNHLNGWKTNTEKYIENCDKFEEILNCYTELVEVPYQDIKSYHRKLFRPPFGKLTTKQSNILQKKGYKIIMWDLLSADFDQSISKERCLENVLENIQVGSVVVFHDSLKSEEKLRFVLPKVLEYIKSQKWKCARI